METLNDVTDLDLGYPELFGKINLSRAGIVVGPYGSNLYSREFRLRVILPFRRDGDASASFVHLSHVFFLRSDNEMGWTHTCSVIALVQDVETFGNRSNEEFPGNAMSTQ